MTHRSSSAPCAISKRDNDSGSRNTVIASSCSGAQADLRRVGGEPVEQLGPDFYQVYQDAIAKQYWYREYLLHQGSKALPFVGSRTVHDDPARVASDMRQSLDVTAQKAFRQVVT